MPRLLPRTLTPLQRMYRQRELRKLRNQRYYASKRIKPENKAKYLSKRGLSHDAVVAS
jgi:hypothetical protein